ncbi:MAG: hypothetical protein COS25_01545 [Candidatus Nealsonbacteria bacterium CG02_land_8_20_14_3_00_37_10]|uniref:TIGR00374 family protein n=1 Tax=Candidatus Nealsonbacteria bacterium CG02_land_8_20_14_3_00_37_10 TaxID=1974699 RepID=A0A2M7D9H6_9BACT|nr:MAG: hypothetical protein COS25_01545 [Candidatus Nealsonbacteria bacterium CG02_land_8_20_14_3_00_37_10]
MEARCMKKFLLFLVSLLIGIGLFIWVIKFVGWPEIKNAFFVFTGWQGIVILSLSFLMALIGTWKWKRVLEETGAKISFQDIWKAYLASFSIRFLAPIVIVGAEIFQGYILKKKNSIPWSQGIASVIIDRILEWTANLTVIFFGGIFFLLMIGFLPMNLVIIFGSVFLIFLAGVSFFYFKAFKKESITKAIGKLFNHKLDSQPLEIEKEFFNFFKPKKRIMWQVFGLNFLRAGVMLLRTWLLIGFLGKSIGVLPALSILGFTYLAVMIPIPAALGSHEVIQTFAFSSLDLGAAAATAFTMIIRGAELIVALFGIAILFRLGIFLIKDTFFKKINNFAKNNDDRH